MYGPITPGRELEHAQIVSVDTPSFPAPELIYIAYDDVSSTPSLIDSMLDKVNDDIYRFGDNIEWLQIATGWHPLHS